MSLEKLGAEIKMLREKMNLSQRELANNLGISPSYLCKIEKGTAYYFPSDQLVKRLSKSLKVSEELLTTLNNRIPKETYDDYIFLVKKYPEMTHLIREMAENPRFAEEIIAQVNMKYLL
ncbi:helix-turn-helix domain-containing protein [Dapis sp. BLCC M229]|uniref:helix-turn-helix domain-containing protein n=1 Tax=Dapis sp. BLCC M229 TaxID=3400188 RepID=UPI003CF7381B